MKNLFLFLTLILTVIGFACIFSSNDNTAIGGILLMLAGGIMFVMGKNLIAE